VRFKVIWEPVAVSLATRFLADDPMDCMTCSRLSMLSRTSHDHLMPSRPGHQGFIACASGGTAPSTRSTKARTVKIRHVGRRA
jgi:hypothetical protein